MGRTRQTITQTLRSLKELEEQYSGTPQEPRLTMLRLLKEVPTRTLGDVSPILGRSERSLQRWWNAYKLGGIEGLLDIGQAGGRRPRRLGDMQIEELREKVRNEGVNGLHTLQEWLRQQHNVNYSRSGLSYLLRKVVGARQQGWILFDEAGGSGGDHPRKPLEVGIPTHIVHFLNALPLTGDAREWGSIFRDALRNILGDVDRISININLKCDLAKPDTGNDEKAEGQFSIITHQLDGAVKVAAARTIERHFERVLDGMKQYGFPFNEYQAPYCYDLHYQNQEYLGTIILWREIGNPPISGETIETMGAIQPFLIFALSDLVARHQLDSPIDHVFNDALGAMIDDAGLTAQEQRIVILQLMGHSYKEMADILSVSLDTVKKHFKQIHKKTGTRGQAELFAKYFTSRLRSTIETEE